MRKQFRIQERVGQGAVLRLAPCLLGLCLAARIVGMTPGTTGSVAKIGDGMGGPATLSVLSSPVSLAMDRRSQYYFVSGNQVLKVDTAGRIALVAGNGIPGYSGDGGPAASAQLNGPEGVAVDGSGNLFIADQGNDAIRKVTQGTGEISTVAGNGSQGFSDGSGTASSAQLASPEGVAVDGSGNLFIADTGNFRIREVTRSTGKISTVAGNGTPGFSGDGGPAAAAELDQPYGVAVDRSGDLFIADSNNNVIRKVTRSTGKISTVAGNGTPGFSGDGGPAAAAELDLPYGVAVDRSGNLYIVDSNNNAIRKVTRGTGGISTVAGNGREGFSIGSGTATTAELNFPLGAAVDDSGNLFIADEANNVIRKVTRSTGKISTVAGHGAEGFSNGPGTVPSRD